MANHTGRFFEGLVVGGLLGFIFGILAAPKSGAELRRQIADGTEDLYKQASDQLVDIRSKTDGTIAGFKERGGHALEDVRHKSEEVLKKASDSVQSGKDQIATKLSEIAGKSTKVLVDDVESATSGS